MTKQEISVLMGIMRTAYPRFYADMTVQDRDDIITLWQAMLSDIDLSVAKPALYRLIATSEYPPTIAAMRESVSAVTHVRVKDAGEAWRETNQAIREYGYQREQEALASMDELTRKTVERMGWRSLCVAEEEKDAVDRAHFMRIYDSLATRVAQDRLLPAALREKLETLAGKMAICADAASPSMD